jgi:N-acetylmuramoyl-L-alanine amidase-like protein
VPRFDCATWRPISANTSGLLSPNIGLVLHHAVMNGSGWALFNNPNTKASAHFWVFQDGRIEQYVDTGVIAWHGMALNSRYVGVETEGCASPPHADAMTEAMVAALGRLYAEGMRRHGWQNRLANANGQPGFGFHRMEVATACPCDIRLNRRQEILNRASGSAAPQPPKPPEPEEEADMIMIQRTSTGGTAMYDGAVKRAIIDGTSATAYRNAGIKVAVLSGPEFDNIPWISQILTK